MSDNRQHTLLVSSNSPHLQQLYTGLSVLARSGEVTLRQRIVDIEADNGGEPWRSNRLWHAHADVEAGDVRLHFDLLDGPEIDRRYLARSSVYFKRSFSPQVIEALGKCGKRVRPYGLNYLVYPNSPDHLAIQRAFRLSSGRTRLRDLVRALGAPSFGAATFTPRIRDLEPLSTAERNANAVFFVAAWDPDELPVSAASERAGRVDINNTRAQCIRSLRRALGKRFLGGFVPSAFARNNYPDLVVDDPAITSKSHYLRTVRQSAVGVATTGLHGSIGWKFAEYIACGIAVVSEPLMYRVPGLHNGVHYLEFNSAADLVEKALLLLERPGLRLAMMEANRHYYEKHLSPTAMLRRMLAYP